MAKIKVEMNSEGVIALLKDPEVAAELARRGRAVEAAAGPGHEMRSYIGHDRARVTVKTVSAKAKRDEAKGRNLLKALDAARDGRL